MSKSCKPSLLPRMWLWTIITLCLMVALALSRPEQLQVVLYKAGLVTLGAVLGYWIDRSLYPYEDRPHQCIGGIHIVGAWLRRAVIVLRNRLSRKDRPVHRIRVAPVTPGPAELIGVEATLQERLDAALQVPGLDRDLTAILRETGRSRHALRVGTRAGDL